jgi:hypothetical protein
METKGDNTPRATSCAPARPRRGRPKATTLENLERLLALVAEGDLETHAATRVGISLSVWFAYKRRHPEIKERLQAAKAQAAEMRYQQKKAALDESYAVRQACGRKAGKPQPIKQAKTVAWMLTRLPLNVLQIPPDAIRQACQKVSLDWDRWLRQDQAFKILQGVYKRRAELRGQEMNKATLAYLFPQNPEYRQPASFGQPINDYWGMPEGFQVGL